MKTGQVPQGTLHKRIGRDELCGELIVLEYAIRQQAKEMQSLHYNLQELGTRVLEISARVRSKRK